VNKMIDNKTKLEGMLNKKIKSKGPGDLHATYLYDRGNLDVNQMAQMDLGNSAAFEVQEMMPLQKQLRAERPDLMQMDFAFVGEMEKFEGKGKKTSVKFAGLADFPIISKKIKLIGD
jgi:hypothetical protein